MTLEKALERIIELETQLSESQTAYESLNIVKSELEQTIEIKDNEIGSLRESNMNFFLKLSQQEQTTSEPEEIKATPQTELKTWDEFLEEL